MNLVTRFLGALLLAYFVRLPFLRWGERRLSPLASAWMANVVGGAVLALLVGLLKATLTTFNASAAIFYVIPQACWLIFDLWRLNAFKRKVR